MPEAVDYEHTHPVFSYFGNIVGNHCGDCSSAPSIEVFSLYANLTQSIRKRFSSSGWSVAEIVFLEVFIGHFNAAAARVFGRCQAFGMETSKCHHLLHFVASKSHIGSFGCFDACVSESSHKSSKFFYKIASKNSATGMLKTIAQEAYRIIADSIAYKIPMRKLWNAISARTASENSTVLVGNAKIVPYFPLRDVLKHVRDVKGDKTA